MSINDAKTAAFCLLNFFLSFCLVNILLSFFSVSVGFLFTCSIFNFLFRLFNSTCFFFSLFISVYEVGFF